MRAVVIAALLAAPATAGATEVTLHFQAPASCAGEQAFRAGVDGRTEQARWVDRSDDATRLEVVIEGDGTSVRGRLVVHEPGRPPRAPREVADDACDTVIDALALVAALAIDPNASLTPVLQPPPSIPSPAPPPRRPLPEPEPPPRAPQAEPGWRTRLGAQIGLTSGFGEAGALELVPLYGDLARTGADWRPSLRLGFSVMLPHEVERLHATARLTRFAGQLSGCPFGLDLEALWLAPCGGAELGALRVEGLEVEEARTATELWAAVWVALRTSVPLVGPLAFDGEAMLSIPITRTRVLVEPDALVTEVATVISRISAGLSLELP